MAVAQSDLDNLSTLINGDGTQPQGAKSQCESHLYAMSKILFPVGAPTSDGSTPTGSMSG